MGIEQVEAGKIEPSKEEEIEVLRAINDYFKKAVDNHSYWLTGISSHCDEQMTKHVTKYGQAFRS